MKVLFVQTDSNSISNESITVEMEDIVILQIWDKLRFLIQGSTNSSQDWTEWKCIEEVPQCDNLPEDDAILLCNEGTEKRKGDKRTLNLLLTAFRDNDVKSFLGNAVEIASFREDRIDALFLVQLLNKSGITPSPKPVNYAPRPKIKKEEKIKLEIKNQLPEYVPVTPQIRARMKDLKSFVLQMLDISLKGKSVNVDVLFNRESESICNQYKIPCPKDFLILVEAKNISKHQIEIGSFVRKDVRIINDNLLYWEDKNI